jgi:hypothetical protein
MARLWIGTWKGGRIAQLANGKQRYVLERKHLGRNYAFRLKATSLDEAERQLALWESEPVRYIRAHEVRKREAQDLVQGEIRITEALLTDLKTWLEGANNDAYARSTEQVKNVVAYCREWGKDLAGYDLRKLSKKQLDQALVTRPHAPKVYRKGKLVPSKSKARRNRVVAFKTMTAMLKEQGKLDPGQDPGRFLKTPSVVPAKSLRTKGYDAQALQRAYRAIQDLPGQRKEGLAQIVRDVMRLSVCYGMHLTEIRRTAKDGRIRELEGQGEIAGTLAFVHKNGDPHVISLDAQAVAAARRLQALKTLPVTNVIRKVLKAATTSIGLSKMNPGEFRHTTVTLGQNGRLVHPQGGGVSLKDIALIVGHRSTDTSRRFYDMNAIPPMLVVPVSLEHSEDPVPMQKAKTAS